MTIYKGDDTGGLLGKKLILDVQSPFDLQGCVLLFCYQSVTRKFENVATGDRLEIFFSHNETMKMSVGTFKATLVAVDAAGKVRTVTDNIKIKVSTNLAECYGGDEQITVTIGTAVDWSNIIHKPFEGLVVDLSTDDKKLAALGTIIEHLGGTIK